VKRTLLSEWAEGRAFRQGSLGNLGRSLSATLWVMVAGPVFWVALMPLFGGEPDAVLYALAGALILALAGHICTLALFRRWKH
jgi:hypothetical protein